MTRTLLRAGLIFAALGMSLAASSARADFVGSFGINGNMPTILPAGGLATATTFSIASMATNGNTTGGFNGIPVSTAFSGGTFTLGSPTGFSFSNSTYGTFTQTTAAVMQGPPGTTGGVVTSESFYIVGTYVGGPVGATAIPASFTVSFTQNGGSGNSISASGTITIPPAVTPEPASVIMLGIGLAGLGGVTLRRRMKAQG